MKHETWEKAILKSLENIRGGTAKEIYEDIAKNGYYALGKGKTPESTVQSQLGDFIRKKDGRVKRMKNKDDVYLYYLTKYEYEFEGSASQQLMISEPPEKQGFNERDLHPLLCTYLSGKQIRARTIFHEQSTRKDENQKWIHPDIVGAKFAKMENETCKRLFNAINHTNRVDIYSYELKKAINRDNELKMAYFQAVSNSSWANYGYLVAFEIGDNLRDEIERLNQSFGIGVILLKAYPYESEIMAQSRRREIDFKTMDKLCKANKNFEEFYGQVEKVLTADTKFIADVESALDSMCDETLNSDREIERYCKDHNIPQSE